jgi:hypothetical protein
MIVLASRSGRFHDKPQMFGWINSVILSDGRAGS